MSLPNVYFAPVVTLISRPVFIEPEHLPINWQGESTDGERLAEFAGRLCYMSQHNPAKRETHAYFKNILEQGHGSILEHVNYSVLLEGVSRSLTHELVRHRAGFAYSQLSQRYVDESDAAFVAPPAIVGDPVAVERWYEGMCQALARYRELSDALVKQFADEPNATIRRKRAREAARTHLPNATETKIVVTGNVRAWRHFLATRGAAGTDQEIHRLARVLATLLATEAPCLFQDMRVTTDAIGFAVPKV